MLWVYYNGGPRDLDLYRQASVVIGVDQDFGNPFLEHRPALVPVLGFPDSRGGREAVPAHIHPGKRLRRLIERL